jgi:hypothetical protein
MMVTGVLDCDEIVARRCGHVCEAVTIGEFLAVEFNL